jgi:hypothetical protein
MIPPIPEKQKTLIIKNLVSACKDINKLNGTGYRFISTASGFIAHYDINGFKAYYDRHKLQKNIEVNAPYNMFNNFREGDENYAYYMSRKDIYQRVLGYFVAQEFMDQHVQFVHVA